MPYDFYNISFCHSYDYIIADLFSVSQENMV